ncbi:helix-turn-helix domain-containing protein [Kitasatospora sp. NPDC088351]|uniref:TetR/AcrR family transcriptional regulator n=1 Tax=Kitasatospora sp. NPDC088351 TaxID=3155180 RepID=UPI003428F76B
MAATAATRWTASSGPLNSRLMFADEGVLVSLERIARHAGVGSATLHRHFRGRRALAAAVLDEQVRGLCARADRLSAELPPGPALEAWLLAVVRHSGTFRGLAVLLSEELAEPGDRIEARHDRVRATGAELLRRAQRAGAARADVTVSELLGLANAIAIATAHGQDRERQARHLLDLVVTGVRPRAATPPRASDGRTVGPGVPEGP